MLDTNRVEVDEGGHFYIQAQAPAVSPALFLPLGAPDSHSGHIPTHHSQASLSFPPWTHTLPSALSFPHPVLSRVPLLCLDISSLGEASLHPWTDWGARPSASPIWLLARTDYVSTSKRHRHGPCLQRAQEPKTLKHRARLTSHECNPQCPDHHCRLSCLVMTKGAGTKGHIPKPAPLCPRPSLTVTFQFQHLSLHCLNPWPQSCFIPLILHFEDCSSLFLPHNQSSGNNMAVKESTSFDFRQS